MLFCFVSYNTATWREHVWIIGDDESRYFVLDLHKFNNIITTSCGVSELIDWTLTWGNADQNLST